MTPKDEGTRSTGSTSASRTSASMTRDAAPASAGAGTAQSASDIARDVGTLGGGAPLGRASGSAASSTTRKTSNASADNVLPAGESATTIEDPIYGQPGGPVLSRSDRVERDEILRRRTTPERYEQIMQQRADEAADAERKRAESE